MISKPLVLTKVHIPDQKKDWIVRKSLIKQLNDGLNSSITLLSTPAGYGKTSLLSAWAHQLQYPIAWMTVDEADNDPVRFLTYFIESLNLLDSHLGQGLIPTLQIPQNSDIELIILTLMNQIFTLGEKFVFIFDDFHYLNSLAIINLINYLVNNQVPNLHLVFSTRIDPPIPLARLRGRGQLNELRQTDLQFNQEESASVIRNIYGEDLLPDEISALIRRTEGWITGIKLAAMSLRFIEGKKAFIKNISGSDKFIAEYLTNEVLKQIPNSINAFLLQTSILDRLCAPLCEMVTEQPNAQQTLEWLHDANFFIDPLDSQHIWYRYHPMFRDLLQNRLKKTQPELISDLHRRAGKWYKSEAFWDEAINHLFKAGEFQLAADLITRVADDLLLEGYADTYVRWMDTLPKEVREENPMIMVHYIFLLFIKGTPPSEISSLLEKAEKIDREGSVIGEIMLLRSYVGLDKIQNHQLVNKALELIPSSQLFFRSMAAAYFASIEMLKGNLDVATKYFYEVIQTSQRINKIFLVVLGYCRLAEIALCRAQLHESEALYQQALEYLEHHCKEENPLSGDPLIGLGRIFYERNELEKAKEYLIRGIKAANIIGATKTMIAHITLAFIWLGEGELEQAHQSILQAQQITENSANPEVHRPIYRSSRIHFELLQGDLIAANRMIELSGVAKLGELNSLKDNLLNHPFPFLRIREVISLATIGIAKEQYQSSLNLLDELLILANQSGWMREVLIIQLQRALSFRGCEKSTEAIESIANALAIAEPEGFIRPFIELGRPMFELIHQTAGKDISPGFSRRLLREFQNMRNPLEYCSSDANPQPIIEPLTSREIEVLVLLKEGHTNLHIAEVLVVSSGTIKKHLDNIYQKLGVHNRTEAVARAHEYNLI